MNTSGLNKQRPGVWLNVAVATLLAASASLGAAFLKASATERHSMAVSLQPNHGGEASFMAETASAMERMMTQMQVPASNSIDLDFVAMMMPHHQGAIDMARAELKYGIDQQSLRLAQEIIVTQDQEIALMKRVQARLRESSEQNAPPGSEVLDDIGMATVCRSPR
jgi:uncharacterized protein (DUF305 family)